MNALLLQKIEELTLYVIKQQEEIEQLKALNNKLDYHEIQDYINSNMLFCKMLNAQWHLLGDYNPIPGIPYEYTAGLITGGVSKASEDVYTWEVINGKIRDQDGNYTVIYDK